MSASLSASSKVVSALMSAALALVVTGDAGDADALVVCVFLVVAVDLVEKTRKDPKSSPGVDIGWTIALVSVVSSAQSLMQPWPS